MKKLSVNELEIIIGGKTTALDIVCGGVGATAAALTIARIALGPIGTGVTIGCAAYGLGRVLDWW